MQVPVSRHARGFARVAIAAAYVGLTPATLARGEEGAASPDAAAGRQASRALADALAAPTAQAVVRRALAVVEAQAVGVDPVVAAHVTAQLQASARELGYSIVERAVLASSARELALSYPPTPADLWRLTYAVHADRGVFARVWAQEGRYVVELVVASLDGTGPFFDRGDAPAEELRATVAALLGRVLPRAEIWRGASGGSGALAHDASDRSDRVTAGSPRNTFEVRKAAPPRFGEAALLELAFGTTDDGFTNVVVGGRLDVRLTGEVFLGAFLGYANLRGRVGRASNVLPYLQIEDRVRVSDRHDILIPLRFGLGYLPLNGPFVRMAAGLSFPLGSDLRMSLDLLAPTFWVLPDRTVASVDIAAEVQF